MLQHLSMEIRRIGCLGLWGVRVEEGFTLILWELLEE